MRISIGSDENTHLTNEVIKLLTSQHTITKFGALNQDGMNWPTVAMLVAESVAKGESEQGVIFCWTGTGVSIAANKIPGIRAALCVDAETAKGARMWNDANVLVMSLRLTTYTIAKEILTAWVNTKFSLEEQQSLEELINIEKKFLTRS